MNRLEVIRNKLKELRLYREYLLKFKAVYELNDNNNIVQKEVVKVKKLKR